MSITKSTKDAIWIIVSLVVFFVINNIQFSGNLTPQGQAFLAVTACMLVIWITEAVTPAVSTFILIGLLTIWLPFTTGADGKAITSNQAFTYALSGFTSSAWLLVLCAFFIVAAVQITGLGERIGLIILKIMGSKPKRVCIGIMIAAGVLNMFIPGGMPVAALLTSIMVGIVAGYGLDMKSNTVKAFFLTIALSTLVGNVFILTGGAPAIQTAKFINDGFGYQMKYLEYMMYGLPLALIMYVLTYFIITKVFPPEIEELPGGGKYVRDKLAEIGPLSAPERKLLIILLLTIAMWATGGYLHDINMSSVALVSIIAMLFPGMGMGTFKEMSVKVAWGTMMFFGAAISMGTGLLNTGAAEYIAKKVLLGTGMQNSSMLVIIIVGLLFFAVASLAFSARGAAISAMIPSVIAFSQLLNVPGFNAWGFTLIMYYPILFSCILPVNSPCALIPYGTGAFETKDMLKVTIPWVLSIVVACVLLYLTYWHWIGLV